MQWPNGFTCPLQTISTCEPSGFIRNTLPEFMRTTEPSVEYTHERVLFGRTLAHNQTIQVRLAEMARQITTAQLLALQLGRLKDSGAMTPAQVSLAKWNNCRIALDIARDARDMLGGAGISAEYVPIRHMLNLESVITYEGTETIHQLTIGRALTGVNAF